MIDNIIKRIVQEKIYDIHTSLIAEVVRVGIDTIDVKPLLKRKYKDKEEEYPTLVNLKYRKEKAEVEVQGGTYSVSGGEGGSVTIPNQTVEVDFRPFEVGDKVVVVFSERAIDGVGGRSHSLSDGMVVARL